MGYDDNAAMGAQQDALGGAEDARRRFLVSAGKFALVVPPTMTLLLATTMSSPAIAKSGQGITPGGPDGDNPGGPGNPGVPDNFSFPGNPGGPGGLRGAQPISGPGLRGAPGAMSPPGGAEAVLGAPPTELDVFTPGGQALGAGPPQPQFGHPPSVGKAILGAGERG